MTTVEKINSQIEQLPEPFQKEVLNFVEFMLLKSQAEIDPEDDLQWSRFSISQAMHGIEDKDIFVYNESDLKERWR
ncbi:MAG: DUF2281 domain-containing protein [bacterium]